MTTILFFSDPWSIHRTPENHRYPAMSNGLPSHKSGSLPASLKRLMAEADQAKRQSAWIYRLGNATMCQSRKKVLNQPASLDHRCSAKLMQNQLFVKDHLISKDIITNPCQFITQGPGGNDRICLGRFSVIVAAVAIIVSTGQISRF